VIATQLRSKRLMRVFLSFEMSYQDILVTLVTTGYKNDG
jgi:hypothetical protein